MKRLAAEVTSNTDYHEGVRQLKEYIKRKSIELAEQYCGERIKIEINIDKSKNDCKISVTDHE